MTYDPRVFPYRYGHALMAYIGERWGDEVIGEVLHAVAAAGVESGFRQALHLSLEDLSAEWHYEVRKRYLPSIAQYVPARLFARPGLDEKRTGGSMHVAGPRPRGTCLPTSEPGRSSWTCIWRT
jgi:hypothetical protein